MLSNRVRWNYYAATHRSGVGPLRDQASEHAPRHPDHPAVFADLDPELHRLPLGIPAGVLSGSRLGNCAANAILLMARSGENSTVGEDRWG